MGSLLWLMLETTSLSRQVPLIYSLIDDEGRRREDHARAHYYLCLPQPANAGSRVTNNEGMDFRILSRGGFYKFVMEI